MEQMSIFGGGKKVERSDGELGYKTCCAFVFPDNSTYECQHSDKTDIPKFVGGPGGLPDDVTPKRCDCEGKNSCWRGGEMVNGWWDEKEKADVDTD